MLARLIHRPARPQCGNECATCESAGGKCLTCFFGEPDKDGVCPAAIEAPPCDVDGCERCAKGDKKTCELCEPRTKTG